MLLLANLLSGIAWLLDSLIYLFILLLIARAILSWVNPDPNNAIVQFIHGATDPVLRPLRRRIPPLGMLDVSVIVAILALGLVQRVVVQSMYGYAALIARSASF